MAEIKMSSFIWNNVIFFFSPKKQRETFGDWFKPLRERERERERERFIYWLVPDI